jgi:hypothetical protein
VIWTRSCVVMSFAFGTEQSYHISYSVITHMHRYSEVGTLGILSPSCFIDTKQLQSECTSFTEILNFTNLLGKRIFGPSLHQLLAMKVKR